MMDPTIDKNLGTKLLGQWWYVYYFCCCI